MRTPSWMLMALAAGALSGVLFLGVMVPSLLSILMFYAAPLPLFMVGVAFGMPAAALGALSGLLFTGLMLNVKAAAFYLLSTGVAPAILSLLAAQWRPASGGQEGEAADDSGREWYPEGRLVLWTAVMGGVLMSLLLLLTGPDMASIEAALGRMADQMLRLAGAAAELPKEQLRSLRAFIVTATPLVSTALWIVATLANMWAAVRLVRAMGYDMRPWAPFWRLTFHPRAMAALAVASFASFLPGVFGLIGEVFAIALMTAFAILGFAVLHALTLGNPWRKAILAVLYIGLLLMGWLVILPMIILGLADLTFGLRRRYLAGKGQA